MLNIRNQGAVTMTYVVYPLCVAIEVGRVLRQHFQWSAEGAPCQPIGAMCMRSSKDIGSIFVDRAVNLKARSICRLRCVSCSVRQQKLEDQ
jgi:hypothetical protein